MSPPPSPIAGPLLGLLLEQPGYAYDLANRLVVRLGPAWKLSTSAVYGALDRLERDSLVSPETEATTRPRAPDRVLYHPTAKAEAEFERWMDGIAPKVEIRRELVAKLCVAQPHHLSGLHSAFEAYEQDCLALLAAMSAHAPPRQDSWDELLACMSEDAAVGHLRSEIRWARRCRGRLEEFLEGGAPGG
jgi:DNA-binding PadR family transcriptional regulator